jgi:adenylate kinase family enzyme
VRIVLLGCAGAGKTTLAKRLSAATGAPLICLDAIWLAGWGSAEVPAFRATLAELHAGDAWIVWLEPPRWLCALRAIRRVFRPGEPHRLAKLPDVLRFIWGFERINRPRIEAERLMRGPNVRVVRLRKPPEIKAFPSSLSLRNMPYPEDHAPRQFP